MLRYNIGLMAVWIRVSLLFWWTRRVLRIG